MFQTRHFIYAAIAALTLSCGQTQKLTSSQVKEAWDPANDPSNFNVHTARFAELPLEGRISDSAYPWSDDYWATRKAGTAFRWRQPVNEVTGTYEDFRYQTLSREVLSKRDAATAKLIDTLSPAEKYDLLRGRYDFPLVQNEFANQLSSVDPELSTPDVPNWFGICHGWAPATILEKEPGSVAVMTNPEGIKIPFYTSDINALMSKVYADNRGSSTMFIGKRCERTSHEISRDIMGRVKDTNCRDTNPGTLHLVMAQMLGAQKPEDRRAFVADVTHHSEVWNQAITGFKVTSAEVSKYHFFTDRAAFHRARGTHSLVHIKAQMSYVKEIGPHAEPKKSIKESYTRVQELEYTLELDRNGVIIGGEWISEQRPDFIWLPSSAPRENEILSYKLLKEISEQSRR